MSQSYGASILLEPARRAAAAAVAEARRNAWTMAVAIVDIAGELVYFEKMDDTQNGSVKVAVAKARSAALFKRPTKAFQDTLTATPDGLRILGIDGAVPVEGGVPLVVDGMIVGAIGVSGGTSQQDGVCAKAAVDAL
jgi:glc operon protein GlcG